MWLCRPRAMPWAWPQLAVTEYLFACIDKRRCLHSVMHSYPHACQDTLSCSARSHYCSAFAALVHTHNRPQNCPRSTSLALAATIWSACCAATERTKLPQPNPDPNPSPAPARPRPPPAQQLPPLPPRPPPSCGARQRCTLRHARWALNCCPLKPILRLCIHRPLS